MDVEDGQLNQDVPDAPHTPRAEPIGNLECPLPMSHDRAIEASHFLSRMEHDYHDPQLFRFNLNAYLSSLRAVTEMLLKETERLGKGPEWKVARQVFSDDTVLAKFTAARNAALHQKAIYDGSQVDAGMFRGRKLKLAFQLHVDHDQKSGEWLKRLQTHAVGLFIDEKHSVVGEQLGVSRTYIIPKLSAEEDALRASRRAFARMTKVVDAAHKIFGMSGGALEDDQMLNSHDISHIMVLLESDVDPTLPDKWGWND